jgi:hypothetical protein
MESIQGIVVGAEILRRCLTANRSIEHPATGELIDHDENPVRSQRCGFTAEQIVTPQTVLHVAEERQPGWASRVRFRPVMNAQGYGAQHPC